jgi:hypothetical protein
LSEQLNPHDLTLKLPYKSERNTGNTYNDRVGLVQMLVMAAVSGKESIIIETPHGSYQKPISLVYRYLNGELNQQELHVALYRSEDTPTRP